jgi:hypothetical protein
MRTGILPEQLAPQKFADISMKHYTMRGAVEWKATGIHLKIIHIHCRDTTLKFITLYGLWRYYCAKMPHDVDVS